MIYILKLCLLRVCLCACARTKGSMVMVNYVLKVCLLGGCVLEGFWFHSARLENRVATIFAIVY